MNVENLMLKLITNKVKLETIISCENCGKEKTVEEWIIDHGKCRCDE